MATPLTPPRLRLSEDEYGSSGIARSLPRDYGASLKSPKQLSFSPQRHFKTKTNFTSPRDHLGGSWDHLETRDYYLGGSCDQLESPYRARDNYLGGSWDQLDYPRSSNYHLTGSWDQLTSCPNDSILTYNSETVKIISPEALITHTLSRPSKKSHSKENSPSGQPQSPPEDLSSPRDSVAGAKGLLNGPGQNNCFLNSAVQVSNHKILIKIK